MYIQKIQVILREQKKLRKIKKSKEIIRNHERGEMMVKKDMLPRIFEREEAYR